MDRYGCEENTHILPKKFLPFLRQMKLPKMYFVPRRGYSCLTGSGLRGKCHSNVIKLCLVFGGKQMIGYEVAEFYNKTEKEKWKLNFHSVWITPEGKMVNVTDNTSSVVYRGFLPLQINHPEDYYDGCYLDASRFANRIIISTNSCETEGVKFAGSSGVRVLPFGKPFDIGDFYEPFPDTPYTQSDELGSGGFTRPSTATGKTFDEIWNERMVA